MRANLEEIKHQIQLTHVSKERIQHFYKEVDGLEIREFIIISVYADAEE
jgi:hypothetical protein